MFCKRMIEILKEGLNLNKRTVTDHNVGRLKYFLCFKKGNTPLNSIQNFFAMMQALCDSGKFHLLVLSLRNYYKEGCEYSVNQLHVLWTRKMLNTVEWIVLGNVYCGCTLMTGAYRLATAEASRAHKLLMSGRPRRFTINPQGNGKTQIPVKSCLYKADSWWRLLR